MTPEERKYKIFKLFYHNDIDKNTLQELEESITKHKHINYDNFNIMNEAFIANTSTTMIRNNRRKYGEVMENYNELLSKISNLSKELNFQNSLELNILFSYLLWNGYLSKDKEYKFSSNDKKNIPGLFFSDIMDGRGVCLNNTEMLKDFLVFNGYSSAIVQNYYNHKSKINYEIKIRRENDDIETKEKLIEILFKKNANHVFNLIEDNEKTYIYDPTNLSLHKVVNSYKSILINGSGEFKLFPYRSYMNCDGIEEIKLLDKLIKTKESPVSYTKEDFISTSEVDLELIRSSSYLIEKFYNEARQNIINISNETNKIKKRTI